MRSVCKIKKLFWSAVASLFIMSASFLLMPVAVNTTRHNQISVILVGMMFWIFALGGYVLLILANHERKQFAVKHKEELNEQNRRPGIIMFFSNIPAVVADTAIVCAVILLIIAQFTKLKNTYFIYVMLFVLNFSLHMHCLFNGKIYLITKIKGKRGEKAYDYQKR